MKHLGKSASGMPVYSSGDAVHFLWRWFRLSWPAVLSGKFVDATGETGGMWLCALADLPLPIDAKVSRGWRSGLTVSVDWPVEVLIHAETEDSELNPGQAFELQRWRCTLVVEAQLRVVNDGFSVQAFRVRRTTRETQGLAERYGGDFGFHEWRG